MFRTTLDRFLYGLSPWVAAARALVGAVVVSLIPLALVLRNPTRPLGEMVPDLPWLLTTSIALSIPFTVMIGAATVRLRDRRQSLVALGLLAVMAAGTYLLTAEVAPRQEYQVRARTQPERLETVAPLGPFTPSTLATIRERVIADPPERYSFSIGHPLDQPPNWLTYRIQQYGVLAMLTFLNGILGWAVASRTRQFRRRQRVWSVWALGVGTAVAFFNIEGWTGRLVRQNLSAHGGLYVWAPLVLWLLAIWIVWPRGSRGTEEP